MKTSDLFTAFNAQSDFHLRQVHLYLNKTYYTNMYATAEQGIANSIEINKFKRIEAIWSEYEKNICFAHYTCDRQITRTSVVESALKLHPVYNHPLFDYLRNEADIDHLKQFILNESVLNLEFFDYLALSIVGANDTVKSEIIHNLWDE